MTRHSTRASRVKVGPRMAMPLEMFSLTSSCTRETPVRLHFLLKYNTKGLFSFAAQSHTSPVSNLTWEFELRANLASAHALDRSMRRRKKGRASLWERKCLHKCWMSNSSKQHIKYYITCIFIKLLQYMVRTESVILTTSLVPTAVKCKVLCSQFSNSIFNILPVFTSSAICKIR